jgi:hypothetical protein
VVQKWPVRATSNSSNPNSPNSPSSSRNSSKFNNFSSRLIPQPSHGSFQVPATQQSANQVDVQQRFSTIPVYAAIEQRSNKQFTSPSSSSSSHDKAFINQHMCRYGSNTSNDNILVLTCSPVSQPTYGLQTYNNPQPAQGNPPQAIIQPQRQVLVQNLASNSPVQNQIPQYTSQSYQQP